MTAPATDPPRPLRTRRYRAVKSPSPPLTQDARTRIARRQREIEGKLRAEVIRARGQVTVYDDLQLGNAATLYVQIEIARGAQSRGQDVDAEALTRCMFGVARALRALGLKETILSPPAPMKPSKPLSHALRQAGLMP